MVTGQIIAHLDMDSFYASVEIRDDPRLAGRPVVIGSDPRQGTGRGVVSTCSYEARKLGIHSGMPISQAWHLCPDAVFIRPSGKYHLVSEEIMTILMEWTGEIEQVSIDEAYLDLSSAGSWDDARSLALRIKKRIYEQEHLSCSIGIAPSRTYAKIASDLEKPDGLVVIRPEEIGQVLMPLPATSIPGIGKKSASVLQARGIITITDLARLDIQELQDLFGGHAIRIREIVSGTDRQGLREAGPRKSLGKETTFPEDTRDQDLISLTMETQADLLANEMRSGNIRCRTIGIRVRYTGFITLTRSLSCLHPVSDRETILKASLSLFQDLWDGEPVRLIGIRVSGLVFRDPVQKTLCDYLPI